MGAIHPGGRMIWVGGSCAGCEGKEEREEGSPCPWEHGDPSSVPYPTGSPVPWGHRHGGTVTPERADWAASQRCLARGHFSAWDRVVSPLSLRKSSFLAPKGTNVLMSPRPSPTWHQPALWCWGSGGRTCTDLGCPALPHRPTAGPHAAASQPPTPLSWGAALGWSHLPPSPESRP